MATAEMGMADYFLQGFSSILPDNHPARTDLMQAPRLGKEKHTGLVAYELTDLAVDWLQELVGEEGGDKNVLDNLPAPTVDLEGRRRRILQVRAAGPLSPKTRPIRLSGPNGRAAPGRDSESNRGHHHLTPTRRSRARTDS